MRYIFFFIIIIACSDGGGLVNPEDVNTFSRVSEQVINEAIQSAEVFASASGDGLIFSSNVACVTRNELLINNDDVKLIRTTALTSPFGGDYFAFDQEQQYAIIVSLYEEKNYSVSSSEFTLTGGNDALIYRLRSTGPNTSRIISIHSLRNSADGKIDVCVGADGIVFTGTDLVFNRITSTVTLNFRTRRLD